MVSDTRSARKSRDELDGHGSKLNTKKDSSVQSPGNTGKASTSPLSVRKSKRLEKEMPPLTPPTKRTSERSGTCNTPSSLRRSDRGKKDLSFSSDSKQSSEGPLINLTKKKEKSLSQVTMESKKTEVDLKEVGMKRKNMNAKKFRSFFKKQRIQEIVQDGGNELERSEKMVEISSENFPTSCSTENKDVSESSQDGSVSANFIERCMYPEVAEDAASPSLVWEHCNLEGACLLCSKSKRVGYDSPEQELCSCSPMEEDLATSDLGAAVTSESAREFDCGNPSIEMHAYSHKDGCKKVCGLCNKDGDLLDCEGKSCKRCYHLSCLDPPLTTVLPGVWHCPLCVKKKLLFGVHSVSNGVESLWGVREVEVPNAKGIRQRQFLVKYHGLAHVHNHWVPEKQLLLESPCLVSKLLEKNQNFRWNAEWMVPHRLLWKRPIQDKICIASTTVISVCEFEWLVKWRGLNHDHASWELDNADFLSSSLGQELVKSYEIRRGKAKKEAYKPYSESIARHSEIPPSQSHANESHVLENAIKLLEFLSKCPNAVVFGDQEQATSVVCIHSMIETSWPFLIVTTSESLSQWEADFERLAPLINLIVYSGSSDTRKLIRASEFYDEGGCMMVQVLLSSGEAVLEDLEILRNIKWKAIIIDEYLHPGIANGLEQIKILSAEMRIIMVNGHIKDTTSEYLKIISLVEPHGDFDKLRTSQKTETNDNLRKLKDKLSRFIAYGGSSQVSKFIEYWVPVQISYLQLELYCDALLSKSSTLCSSSRKDPVGVLREVHLSVRKCCDHPYLLDPSNQISLIANKRTSEEIIDIGIKACGKLQLLDAMLPEIKARGLQVLILFQVAMWIPNGFIITIIACYTAQLVDSGKVSTGNILEDLVTHKFGVDAFERIDAAYPPSEKQAAVSRFNMRKTGQFIFLLENRACSSIIRLSSLDVVVVYDSEWNPANDLKALKKISVDSKVEHIKVFRLYSSFTVEERVLMLAKKSLNPDFNSQSFSRSLLSWGATYLFSKLEEYHADNKSSLALNSSSGQLLLDEVNKEFRAILSGNYEKTDSNSVISEATLDVGRYNTNTLMFGESKVQLKDGEVPHVFWKNLLEGKNPCWKHLSAPSPRNRKRVHYGEGSLSNSEAGKDNMAKKCKKMVNGSLGPASSQVDVDEVIQATVSNGGPSIIEACNESENFHRDGQSSWSAEVSVSAALKERIVSSDRQQILHGVLQRETTTLCRTLKLPENVLKVVEMFLEYVIKNHHVSSISTSIVQAFQISLCWVAASITKQKVDKMESLMLAKQLLDYQCTEEEASSVYSKMRSLKRLYLQCSDNITLSSLLAEEDFSSRPSNVNEGGLQHSSNKEESSELEIRDESADKEHVEQQKVAMKDKMDAIEIYDDEIKKVEKKRDKRIKKLIQEHQERIKELLRIWDDRREKLNVDHRLDVAFIRSIHGQSSAGMDKLKVLNDNFEKKIKDHDILNDVQLKNLEAEHLAAINMERQRAADWLAKSSRELRVTNGHQSLGYQSVDDADVPQPSTCIDVGGGGDKFPMSGKHPENENANKSFCTQGNNVTSNISSISARSDSISHEPPVENFVPINSQNESGVESFPIVELLNQLNNSSDDRETVPMNQPASNKQVCNEIQSVSLTEGHPVGPQTVPNEIAGHDHPGELSYRSEEESDKVRRTSLSNDLVSQRGELEGEANGGLHSSGQPSSHSEQTLVLPNFCDLLPDQDSDLLGEENPDAPQIEMEMSESTDFVTHVLTNFDSPIINGIVTTAPSNNIPVDEDFGQLHHFSVDVSCHNQSSATENHDEGRNSPQTAEPEGSEVDLHKSFSHNEENMELHPDCLDVEPAGGVAKEPVVLQDNMDIRQEVVNPPERPNRDVLQNDVVIPQEVASTSQHPNQAILQPDVAITQQVGGTSEPANQAVLQPDVAITPQAASMPEQANQAFRQVMVLDAGTAPPGSLVNPSHQPTFWNLAPSLLSDPLQSELERICREKEQLEKSHADMIAEIKSDCEKNIEEFISLMRSRCEVKCQATEAEFRLKKVELDKNQKKVLLNKKLAEAFRSKCLEAGRASGLPGMQQGIPSFTPPPPARSPSVGPSTFQSARSQPTATPANQTIPQLSRSHSVGPSTSQPARNHPTMTLPQLSRSLPVGPSTCQPARSLPITTPAVQTIAQLSLSPSVGPSTSQPAHSLPIATPAVQTIPQLSRAHSVRSSPMGIRSVTAQPVKHASALVSGSPAARPPVISAITPAQLRLASEVRSAAPHLQPSIRPTVGSPVLPNTSSPHSQLRPGRVSLQPVLPSQLPIPDLVTQKSAAEVQGGIPAPPNPPGFTQRLVADHQPYLPNTRNAPIPDIPFTFHSLEQSDLEMLGNAIANQTSTVDPNVVCLSDDE